MGKKHKIEINEGHYSELMDRLFIATDSTSAYCLKHPLAQKEKKVKKKISKALDLLFDAYQMVGSLEPESEKNNKK
jgi:hypothetical protein